MCYIVKTIYIVIWCIIICCSIIYYSNWLTHRILKINELHLEYGK